MIFVEAFGEWHDVRTDYTEQMALIKVRQDGTVREAHATSGRGTWAALKKDGSPSFLYKTGGMMSRIHSESGENWAETGSGVSGINFIHEFGGWAGRQHHSYIPARPRFKFQESDKEYIIGMVSGAVFTSPTVNRELQSINASFNQPTSINSII